MKGKSQMLSIEAPAELIRQFEAEAMRLGLSPAAYLVFLMARGQPGVDPQRLDRMGDAVFAKYGEVIRRLAR